MRTDRIVSYFMFVRLMLSTEKQQPFEQPEVTLICNNINILFLSVALKRLNGE